MPPRKAKPAARSLTYRDAGLDLNKYDKAMELLPALMKGTHTPRVMDLPGGFAGLFRLGNSPKFRDSYDDPVLVSGTDGVGTKLKIAAQMKVYDTVGIDLVAMSVNDCLCLGATPLFFLDYLAIPKDDPKMISKIVSGVTKGCVESGCALLGGETAVMPDIYAPGDFDLAGFCVAVVERKKLIDGSKIRKGDAVLGIESSGFHSNGYSLVRKAVFESGGLSVGEKVNELGCTVGKALLSPTQIYVRPILDLLSDDACGAAVHGLSHITGGGIDGNLERILPENCCAEINRSSWRPLPVFDWVQKLGNIETEEMYRVFNMGIGFIVVLKKQVVAEAQKRLENFGLKSHVIGKIISGTKGVRFADGER